MIASTIRSTDHEENKLMATDEEQTLDTPDPDNNPFTWMDKVTLCLPMVSFKKTIQTKRSYIPSMIGMIITALIAIFIFVYWSVLSFKYEQTDYMYDATFTIAFFLKTFSRLIMLYYYCKVFAFPWYQITISNRNANKIIRLTNYRIIALSICMLFVFLCQIIRKSVEYTNGKEPIFEFILFVIEMYVLEVPNIWGQFTFSIILLNVRLNIEQLMNDIDGTDDNKDDPFDFQFVLSKYKRLYHKFEEEYYPIWFWMISLKLFSTILWFWIAITNYKNTMYDSPFSGALWSIWNIIFVFEFVYSSNGVTQAYHKLINMIWEIEDKPQSVNEKLSYLFLRSYLINKKLTVKFMKGGEVSIKGLCTFILVFIFVKLATHGVF